MCFSCGGPTRTGDLQVMSLASYQLLHPAMILCFGCKIIYFFSIRQIFDPENFWSSSFRLLFGTNVYVLCRFGRELFVHIEVFH